MHALLTSLPHTRNCVTGNYTLYMNSMKLVIPLHFISWKKDSKRCCDTTTPESIHTKDESKCSSHLSSSLVWIDQYNECNGMTSFKEFKNRKGFQKLLVDIWSQGPPKKSWAFLVTYELLCMSLSNLGSFYSLFHSLHTDTEAVSTVFFTCSVQNERLGWVLFVM